MTVVDEKCTNCGAALPPAPPGALVRCGFCGHSFEHAAPPAPVPVQIVLPIPPRAVRVAAAQRRAGCGVLGCVMPAVLLAGIGGAVWQLQRTGGTGSRTSPGVPLIPPLGAPNVIWDDVGGPPAPFTIGGREHVLGRVRMESDQLYAVAVDPSGPKIAWRFGPLGTYGEGYKDTLIAHVAEKVVVSDFRFKVHVVDAATGKESGAAHLTDRVETFCVSQSPPGLWIGTVDKRGATLDLQAATTREAPRPHGCEEIQGQAARFRARYTSTAAAAPKVAGFSVKHVMTDGDLAVASGVRAPGTGIPRAVGFDPKSNAVRWDAVVPVADPSTVRPGSNDLDALAGGRYVTSYGVGRKAWHLTAFDARSGARLWDTTMPQIFAVDSLGGVVATAGYVYVVRTSSLDVYNAKTGARVGAIGNETYE